MQQRICRRNRFKSRTAPTLPPAADLLSYLPPMSLRQQQAAVFLGTIAVIFGLFSAGVWLVAQRLTKEATLQTALLLARQVEIALADSLRQRPVIVQSTQSRSQPSSFWNFLGN